MTSFRAERGVSVSYIGDNGFYGGFVDARLASGVGQMGCATMYLIVLGVLLLVMKLADFGPVGVWSWWVILAPFGAAVVWWAWADATGWTKRRE
ncbi:TIGR04438 family Trp-rich protein, partial [Piscinibacter sp.]|uniref:TIGR04438 family Trp-rich protein n=1 Tax=Piscinibacter sp. TaxID=1903157 RepID=UPI00355A6ED4